MIECEGCGGYFEPDDIRPCPSPDCYSDDLCPNCYEKHVTKCMLGGMFD